MQGVGTSEFEESSGDGKGHCEKVQSIGRGRKGRFKRMGNRNERRSHPISTQNRTEETEENKKLRVKAFIEGPCRIQMVEEK
jgi:hypothetical protein